MIKVYTSYFYQVRNMREDCLAFSTAFSDPTWYRTKNPVPDKNGVLVGLRAEPFVPNVDLSPQDMCSGPTGCPHREENLPWYCPFLLAYKNQLDKLDPQEIEERFIKVGEAWKQYLNKDLDLTYILLVHEAPTNPCSERRPLQYWLKRSGFGGEEWHKG